MENEKLNRVCDIELQNEMQRSYSLDGSRFLLGKILFATFASWTGTTEQPDGSKGRMPGLTDGRSDNNER
jgi:hypothetical protein